MTLKTSVAVLVVALVTYKLLTYFEGDDFNGYSSLKGKNILLTGASSGIGEQMAYWYARYGANMLITARREGLLKKVVDKCKEIGPASKVMYIPADMAVEEDRERVVKTALEYFGEIDQLILNHAYMPTVYRWNGSVQQLDHLKKIFNTNFISFVHLAALALPSLQKRGGSIAAVGSMAGRLPTPFMNEYCASKFAIDGFFSGLRHEFKATNQNVSVTHCVIGVVETESSSDVMKKMLSMFDAPSEFALKLLRAETAENAANAIISATTRRQGELIYPHYQGLWLQGVVRSVAPTLLEKINFGIKNFEET